MNADDRQDTTRVAIVNQAFVKDFLGSRDPLTTQFTYGVPQPDPKHPFTIVGVVEDVHYESLGEKPDPAFYMPESQSYVFAQQPIIVSARAGDLPALEQTIRRELLAYDPTMVVDISQASDIVAGTLARQRLGTTLMTIFGALALVLSAIGIYGVNAYDAAQRRTEPATRIALGASSANIFWLVMRSGQTFALIGIGIGVLGAYLGGASRRRQRLRDESGRPDHSRCGCIDRRDHHHSRDSDPRDPLEPHGPDPRPSRRLIFQDSHAAGTVASRQSPALRTIARRDLDFGLLPYRQQSRSYGLGSFIQHPDRQEQRTDVSFENNRKWLKLRRDARRVIFILRCDPQGHGQLLISAVIPKWNQAYCRHRIRPHFEQQLKAKCSRSGSSWNPQKSWR